MNGGPFAELARLRMPDEAKDVAGLGPVLRLARCWPRGRGRLSCEFRDDDGRLVAGQWFAGDNGGPDHARLQRVRRLTAAATPRTHVIALPDVGVLLQPAGADRRLPDLSTLVARHGAALVGHRAERRAVVRLPARRGTAQRWVKVVRPGKTAALVAAAEAAAAYNPFRTATVLSHQPDRGLVVCSDVAGTALRDLLGNSDVSPVCLELGRNLRALHEPPGRERLQLPTRDAAAEYQWTREWVRRLQTYAPPATGERAHDALKRVARLLSNEPTDLVPVHADLHDGQVLAGRDGTIGVVDWDTVARGEAATDLANLLVHLEIRVLARHCQPNSADAAAASVLTGYQPTADLRRRISDYAAAIRLRLACAYAFRPTHQATTAALLDRLDAPPVGLEE